MAVAVPNQLLDILNALRRRRYQVIVPAVLVATLGIAFAVIVPKRYRVSMRIDIGDRTRIESDARLRNPQEVAVRREAASAQEHISNYKRVKDFVESNQALWPEYLELADETSRWQFIQQRIVKNLSAQPTIKDVKGGGTIFLEVSYKDEDPARAAKLLEELTTSWLRDVFDADRNTFIMERAEFQAMIDTQERERAVEEERLYQLYELLGVDPSSTRNESRRDEPRDWTFATLERAKTELTDVELELSQAEFELEQARDRLEETPPTITREEPLEADDPEAVYLRKKEQLEAMQEEIENLRPQNSTYKRLKPKIEELEREIREMEAEDPEPDSRFVDEPNPVYDEYVATVREKRDLVEVLERKRDTLRTSVDDLTLESQARSAQYKELAQLENEVVAKRQAVAETRKEWQARDTSLKLLDASVQAWTISRPPLPTTASTEPNPWLIAAFSVVAGLAIGIGLAFVAEFARSCYRSASDLASVMSVPVLGAIGTIVTQRERRRLQVSHATAGLSTAVIVGTIGWITYLWYSSPERLPLELQDAIERLRSALK